MGAGTGVLGRARNDAPPCDPGHRRLDDRAAGRRRRGRRARASDRLRHARGDRRRARPADAGRLSGSGARGGGQPRGRGGACVLRGVPLLGGRHRHAGDVAGRDAPRSRQPPGSRPRRSDSRARRSTLAAPTDFLDLQATALLALARVLRRPDSPEAASVAPRHRRSTSARGTSSAQERAALLA